MLRHQFYSFKRLPMQQCTEVIVIIWLVTWDFLIEENRPITYALQCSPHSLSSLRQVKRLKCLIRWQWRKMLCDWCYFTHHKYSTTIPPIVLQLHSTQRLHQNRFTDFKQAFRDNYLTLQDNTKHLTELTTFEMILQSTVCSEQSWKVIQ